MQEKTLTQILEEVKDAICNDYCKYTDDCMEKTDNGEEPRKCPLDRL